MKKSYWVIFILFAMTAAVSVLYFTKQPAENGVIVSQKKVNAKASPIKQITNTNVDVKEQIVWKTFTSDIYGVQFKYPSNLIINQSSDEPEAVGFDDKTAINSVAPNKGLTVYFYNNHERKSLIDSWNMGPSYDLCYKKTVIKTLNNFTALFIERDSHCGKFPFWEAHIIIGENDRVVDLSTRDPQLSLEKIALTLKFTKSIDEIVVNAPLSYIKNDNLYLVNKITVASDTDFTPASLADSAGSCNGNKSTGYYKSLLSKLAPTDKEIKYEFKPTEKSQIKYSYFVTILPNKFGYKNQKEFEEDFGLCDAGENLYPHKLSNKYLMFTPACSTGYDAGCSSIQNFVEDSLKLVD